MQCQQAIDTGRDTFEQCPNEATTKYPDTESYAHFEVCSEHGLIGKTVRFKEGAAPYAKNAGIDYIIEASPLGAPFSSFKGLIYVWLVRADDMDKNNSARRRRTGYVDDLKVMK